MNDTFLFEIEAKNTEEKVGNVSFLIEAVAFNRNYTHYKKLPFASRRKHWRWRTRTYGFNLSIVVGGPNLERQRKYRIGICQSTYNVDKYFRRFKLANSTLDVCLPLNFGRNLTLTNKGRLSLILGNWFRPQQNFEKIMNSTK